MAWGTSGGTVSVSEYLERARECAALAENMTGDEKTKMLAVAQAWLKVADEAAKVADPKREADPSRSARRRSP
jgi:hypothetical protein